MLARESMEQPDTQESDDHPVLREYSKLALKYDERWSFYVKASLRETSRRIRIEPGQKLLDIGCGTGVLLEMLASRYPEAVLAGIDPVRGMLTVARERLENNVFLQQAWAEALPFREESFAVVVSCNMFHYIRTPEQALRETLRVLSPGGTLIVTDWCDDYFTCKICDLFLRAFNQAHFRTYGERECCDLLASSGFKDIDIERYKISWFWGMMTATARK